MSSKLQDQHTAIADCGISGDSVPINSPDILPIIPTYRWNSGNSRIFFAPPHNSLRIAAQLRGLTDKIPKQVASDQVHACARHAGGVAPKSVVDCDLAPPEALLLTDGNSNLGLVGQSFDQAHCNKETPTGVASTDWNEIGMGCGLYLARRSW